MSCYVLSSICYICISKTNTAQFQLLLSSLPRGTIFVCLSSLGECSQMDLYTGLLDYPIQSRVINIISLDIKAEMYLEILQPECGEGKYNRILSTFGESLSLLREFNTHADLWVLKECGAEQHWTKLFTLVHIERLAKYSHLQSICITEG